jgi:hypothetical protein
MYYAQKCDELRAALVEAVDALTQLRHKAWKQSYPAEEILCNKALTRCKEALKNDSI